MTITLTTNTILSEMRQKSHLETLHIQDLEQRDNARANTDKGDEMARDVQYADSMLRALLGRYLTNTASSSVNDNLGLPASLTYNLSISERRQKGKEEILDELLHSYIVNQSLYRYYISVSQTDLATGRANLASADAGAILAEINRKYPPIYGSNS